MKQLSFLIKPASSLCNLRCTYCFYEDVASHRENASMGIMKETTMHALIDQALKAPVSHIHFYFQGGEPTLAGIDYFYSFINYVNENNNDKQITYAIQTNGILLDDQWLCLFSKYHFLVGVSLDGFETNHDTYRSKGTYHKIMNVLQKMETMNIEYNILTVLTHELSQKPEELFQFYRQHHLNYIQLIPCLPPFDVSSPYALQPKDFSDFYKAFFDLWYDKYVQGEYLSIALFDQLIPMYLGIPPQQCGMLGRCQMQLVVEGDGSVYPCDFYVLDKYCCGNINYDSLEAIMRHSNAIQFIKEKGEIDLCISCPYYKMCYGNCKRMATCYRDKNYCGYRDFLSYTQSRMVAIAKKIYKKRF